MRHQPRHRRGLNELLRPVWLILAFLWSGCGSPTPSPPLDAWSLSLPTSDAGPPAAGPNLGFTPDESIFKLIHVGQSSTLAWYVTNTGNAPALIHSVKLISNDMFEVQTSGDAGTWQTVQAGETRVFQPARVLAPGEKWPVSVTFTPKDPKGHKALILFNTSDPYLSAYYVGGNTNNPCLKLVPADKLVFGVVKTHNKTSRDVGLVNCGGEDLVVQSVQLAAGPDASHFELDFAKTSAEFPTVGATGPEPGKPLVIAANKDALVSLVYAPTQPSAGDPVTGALDPHVTQVLIQANTLPTGQSLPAEGTSVVVTCPTAKVLVKEGDVVLPGTVLHLQGDTSEGVAGGPLTKYKWSVKQPAGSSSVFAPAPSLPNPTFTSQAAGEYEFCLDVWSNVAGSSTKSCAPACAKVLVLPDAAIYVEALWDTPADPDQSDVGLAAGSDMDLHFAHALAAEKDTDCDGKPDPWFSQVYDTWWFNKKPNWASAVAGADDDPFMSRDDTDGAGPEVISLAQPEGTAGSPASYSLGVHYWNDHGFGSSFATINVYIAGVLAVQIDKVKMDVLDMWHVGKVNWPNSMTNGSKSPFEICYKTKGGDPCKGTGKFWQAQGDFCMSKCYVHPKFPQAGSGASKSLCGG